MSVVCGYTVPGTSDTNYIATIKVIIDVWIITLAIDTMIKLIQIILVFKKRFFCPQGHETIKSRDISIVKILC